MKKITLLFLSMVLSLGVLVAQNTYYLSWEVGVTAGTPAFKTENYSVLISTSGTDEADFREVYTETMADDTPNWEPQHRQVELDDTELEGEDIHVAFRHHDSEDHDRLIIFSVRVFAVNEDEEEIDIFSEDFYGGKPAEGEEIDRDWLPEGWLAVDANEDGHNWYYDYHEEDGGYMLSRSAYQDEGGNWHALDPDNWLITSSFLLEVPEFTVTFNVDMTDAVAEGDIRFDPDVHDVFITGTFTGWAEPGSAEEFKMTPAVGKDGVYTITLTIEGIDTHHYKYFLVEDEPTWGIGEWPGDPNREVFIDDDMTIDDVFGSYYPSIDPDVAEFDIRNPADIETTIDWGEATELIGVKLDGDDFENYTLAENTLTFAESIFEDANHEDAFVFTLEFDFGDDVTFTVNVVDSELSVDDFDHAKLSVYPNPASRNLYINNKEIIKEVQLFDISGRLVHKEAIEGKSAVIEVNQFNQGVYLLRIVTENEIKSRKIQVVR